MICHNGCSLSQSVFCNRAAIEEGTEAVGVLDGMHVGVLEDGDRDRLLRQEAHGRARHGEVALHINNQLNETINHRWAQMFKKEGGAYDLGPLRPCMPQTMISAW